MARQLLGRRDFLKTTALTGIGYWVAGGVSAKASKSPNERIRFACIGVGGAKGAEDTRDMAAVGDVVAICDVDDVMMDKIAPDVPRAKRFNDFRRMLDKMEKSIDAVTVTTPDHMHAAPAVAAMRMGKHCFCQKPLSRTIYEARRMGEVAREMKVATQMGNQGTADSTLRRIAAMIRAGIVGPVKEIHVWTFRPMWPQGGRRPKVVAAPKTLHWDLWLGTAPERPFGLGYHPFRWRGYWDFGSGALGDMGCHLMNMPFMALDLVNPISVEAETADNNKESFPAWSIITYRFAANDRHPELKLIWYDGNQIPSRDLFDGQRFDRGGGALVIGEKGKLYAKGDGVPYDPNNAYELFGDVTEPEVEIVESPGHIEEWVRAIQGGEPAVANFPDYATPLTETVLAGNLAVWTGEKVEWNGKEMKSPSHPELEPLIRPTYRKGYSL